MRATLSFKLPDEEDEYKSAVNGALFKFILQDLDNELRSQIKHADLIEVLHNKVQEIRDKLHELCKDRDVDFWG